MGASAEGDKTITAKRHVMGMQEEILKLRDAAWNLRDLKFLFCSGEYYRQILDENGNPFESFEAFCEAPLLRGLGTSKEEFDAITRLRTDR